MSNIHSEENKVRQEISKNRKLTCNWILPKMESFAPQIYIIIQVSNEFFPNMKVEDLVLPFPKSPRKLISHLWLASYDQIILKNFWTSKWHIFQTIWPNWVRFFATSHIWCALSKSFITIHQKSSNQNGLFPSAWIKKGVSWKMDFQNNHFQCILSIDNVQKSYFGCAQGPFSCIYMHPMHFWVV